MDAMKMRNLGCFIFLWLLVGVLPKAWAQTLAVGGTGSSGPLMQVLFDEYRKQAPGVSFHLVTPPLGSNGGMKALEVGRIDLAVAGRPLEPEELTRFGSSFPLADTPFVMASLDGQRRNGFSLPELASVYDNNLQKWDSGARIRLVLRGSFESDTLMLKSMSSDMAHAVDIASHRPGMVYTESDLSTVALLTKTPDALAPTTLGLLATLGVDLKVFPLDGVTPSIVTLKSGTYPWYKRLTVILPKQPSTVAQDFATFLRSLQARGVMEQYQYLPVVK